MGNAGIRACCGRMACAPRRCPHQWSAAKRRRCLQDITELSNHTGGKCVYLQPVLVKLMQVVSRQKPAQEFEGARHLKCGAQKTCAGGCRKRVASVMPRYTAPLSRQSHACIPAHYEHPQALHAGTLACRFICHRCVELLCNNNLHHLNKGTGEGDPRLP